MESSMRDLAPVTDYCRDEPAHDKNGRTRLAQGKRTRKRHVKRWAGLWRTIILSSLGKTLYPYSQYIRTLNLEDLGELLTDRDFGVRTCRDFFHGELAQFAVDKDVKVSIRIVNALESINRIGEVITKQTPLLEELTGRVHERELSRWVPRLPRLTHLKLYNASAVAGDRNFIRLHCPSFEGRSFWRWNETNSDQGLATFLNELCPQSLKSFESSNKIGPRSFQALSCHGEMLTELKLDMLSPDIAPKVSLLKCCTNLVSLSLGDRWWVLGDRGRATSHHKIHNHAFLETVAWLKECKKLQALAFTNFSGAIALTAPILLENSIHLTSLVYEGLGLLSSKKLLRALANQTSLQSLSLETTVKGSPRRAEILVTSLSKLVNLKDLRVNEEFSIFTDLQIMRLARSLPKLEVWSTSGDALTDDIWSAVACLRSLRRLVFYSVTHFTPDGILNFVEKLGPGNKGLVLDVGSSEFNFSRKKQKLIQEKFTEKIGGEWVFFSAGYSGLDPSSSSENESD